MPHWTADYGYEQFKKHRPTMEAALGVNEAGTRLRAIDVMLFDVLGWDRLEVDAERYCRAEGYADYVFIGGAGISLVLEAKKADAEFVLPWNKLPTTASGFALLAKECPAAEKAMLQALGYAASLGARYISVSNGHQWIVSLTFVTNTQVTERSVLAFESLDAVDARFRLFWDCFSPLGVAANDAHHLLVEARQAPPPAKLSQRLGQYPAPADRNRLANELSVVLGAVWEEVRHEEDDEEFLRSCYVEPEASASATALAKELLEQRLSTEERLAADCLTPDQSVELIQKGLSEKPIVVLGKVGHGKTTFLNHLRKVQAKKTLDRYLQLDINFLDRPDHAAEVSGYVYAQVEEQLRETHGVEIEDDGFVRAALNADLNRFRKTPEAKAFDPTSVDYKREELGYIKAIRGDKSQYLKRVFAHLRGSRKQSVAIFFDNLDRRSKEIQEEAYLKASAIARDWAALVFVCLRPNTFYQSVRFGVLDSVAPKIIAINSPKTSPVVTRRLKYAKRYAEGELIPRRAPFGRDFSLQMPSVALFLECMAESFRRNSKLAHLFESISNGNTRELLIYVYNFLTSAHLDSSEVLDKVQSDGKYTVPDHHALRALLYGDALHYDPEKTVFINLFDVQQADPLQHFTRHLTLQYLMTVSDAHPTYGYAPVEELVGYLCQQSYSERHARWTIKYLFDRRLVEAKDPVEVWSDLVTEVKLTSLGRYHGSILITHFAYLDAMAVDTPILDDQARRAVVDVTDIQARLNRGQRFLDYLDQQAKLLTDVAPKSAWAAAAAEVRGRMTGIQNTVDDAKAQNKSP